MENKVVANGFNQFYSSMFTKEDTEAIQFLGTGDNSAPLLTDVCFTKEDVFKQLSALTANKSVSPDRIHPMVFKECAAELAMPLCLLFRHSMDTGVIAREWKDANVVPIYKGGNRNTVSHYRPVSLTHVICEIMEKLVREPLLHHLLDHNLVSPLQHGFIPGRSVVTQLLAVLDL
jgi:hypothetical protein